MGICQAQFTTKAQPVRALPFTTCCTCTSTCNLQPTLDFLPLGVLSLPVQVCCVQCTQPLIFTCKRVQ